MTKRFASEDFCDVCGKKRYQKTRPNAEIDFNDVIPDYWYLCQECANDTRSFLLGLTNQKKSGKSRPDYSVPDEKLV